jgi:hypothetical protein
MASSGEGQFLVAANAEGSFQLEAFFSVTNYNSSLGCVPTCTIEIPGLVASCTASDGHTSLVGPG